MDEEDVIGNEFDRVLRAAAMSAGQAAEAFRRRSQARDEAVRADVLQKQRDQDNLTATIYERVRRDEFWRNANGERVANAATYGATLYNHDPKAREIYEIARERTHTQFGINVDELRAAHPENEEARRNALLNAVDDRLAALRADREASDDRTQAERERGEADRATASAATVDERIAEAEGRLQQINDAFINEPRRSQARHDHLSEQQEDIQNELKNLAAEKARLTAPVEGARERAQEADARADEREDSAAIARGEERGHQAESRGLGGRTSEAGRDKSLTPQRLEVKEAVELSFPEPAHESVARGLRRGTPRARTRRGTTAGHEQVQEISR